MVTAEHRDGAGVLLLLLALLLRKQGGKVKSRALQFIVGPPCHHVTLTTIRKNDGSIYKGDIHQKITFSPISKVRISANRYVRIYFCLYVRGEYCCH